MSRMSGTIVLPWGEDIKDKTQTDKEENLVYLHRCGEPSDFLALNLEIACTT